MTATGTFQAGTQMLSVMGGRESADVFDDLAAELREERRLTQIHLGDPERKQTRDRLGAQRDSTDTARAAAEAETGADILTGDSSGDDLGRLRDGVDAGTVGRADALDRYTELIEDTGLLTAAHLRALELSPGRTDAELAQDLVGAHEEFSRANALLAGAIAAGGMDYEETAHFTHLTASYRTALGRAEEDLRGDVRRGYEAMRAAQPWADTERLSRAVVTRPPVGESDVPGKAEWNFDIGVDADEWEEASSGADREFGDLVATQLDTAIGTAWADAVQRIALALAGCVFLLVAGTASIVIATRASRRLVGRLSQLRNDTLALADTRLPDIVDRAQNGQRVNLAEELPRLSYGRDEIGQVADAFNTAQRTAVGAAVKQAEIREGVNRVFLGIAYRNQALVQRQLHLLDEIEYDEEDPRTLQRLFRLDHLATRARRYADNLIILGGAQSARRWRDPLPLVDVLRAAISETEDYERVRLTSAPRVRLRGTAVADIVHLIAELVENATQFSPAGAPVDVNCGPVAGGIAVDVEDRGLGMTEEGYQAAARTLAEAPEFDVMALPDEPRLGLFVVARLAARHGVRVRLFPSPYGGTRATAILPETLMEEEHDARPEPVMVPDQRSADHGHSGDGAER
ncbi:signal transduction histidine kinase [Nocardiopsis mwathae]|uniref:histidine kinase n=1 Tax=Nocardiopsis mwathae TaxID=1472723 RepID=A0A7W9YFE4_9ACTN|nr:nitrate- and nitrite sensing domain-containing protein [Nocardiopsis mwathae]MBB6171087.1 signal transduction histidine kinase [Nocardiopsis mwathae]